MPDDMRDEIRRRMATTVAELRLPIHKFNTAQDPVDFLSINARPVLYELLGRTAREGLEQGTAMWADEPPEGVFDYEQLPLNVSKIVQGRDPGDDLPQSVDTPDAAVDGVIQIEMHTHPLGGSVGLSEGDWRGVATTLLQYPEPARKVLSRNPTLRAFCVMGQRLGDEDRNVATIKWVQAKPAADKLTIQESRERSQDLFAQLDRDLVFTPASEIIEPVDDLLTTGIGTIDLPKPVERLRFRSAIPDTISDERFGNAFASGDLTEVLEGVNYI